MRWSEERDKVAAALVAAQGEAGYQVGKDSVNPHFKSGYSSLSAVMGALEPALAANDLSMHHEVKRVAHADTGETVGIGNTITLIHASGQWAEFGPYYFPLAKKDVQGTGSSYTYAIRRGVCAVFSLATMDDDGNEASAPAKVEKVSDACVKDFWSAMDVLLERYDIDPEVCSRFAPSPLLTLLGRLYEVYPKDLKAPTSDTAQKLKAALKWFQGQSADKLRERLSAAVPK
jgi:hypothetical protein